MRIKSIKKKGRTFAEYIFFGNYFYGLCAVALSIEATLQQRVPLNGPLYFFLLFISTVLYYNYPYVRKCSIISSNRRTNWYNRHYEFMRWNQLSITSMLIAAAGSFLQAYWQQVAKLSLTAWLMIFIFPIVAAFYYGINFLSVKYNLRKTGWLKPFIIGFTWAGLVTIYPVLFYDMVNEFEYKITVVCGLLFLKNFMFITLLCIMFDIKDYAADYVSRLRTFVVKIGLRKTIGYILVPLSMLGLFSFVVYAASNHFHLFKILLNVIPFLLLMIVARSFCKRRAIMYYLVVIDGLMIVKASCGIAAMLYF